MSHPLLATLASADPTERAGACRGIPDDPAATLLVEALGGALGDADRRVRRAASDALVALAQRDPDSVDLTLRQMLRSREPRARWSAAFTAARLAPPEPRLLPAVAEALGAADGDTRWAAARTLVDMARLHGDAEATVFGLARAADDPVTRRMAIFCLRELAPADPATAQALIEASVDEDRPLRRAALTAIAALANPLPELLERVRDALRGDGDPACRRLAALALGELASRSAGTEGPNDAAASARDELARARAHSDDAGLHRAIDLAFARLGGPRPR